jgi:hypothetical protein
MSSASKAFGDPWAIVLGLFAVGNLVNGVWMLVDPLHWYLNLPANVPGTGPANEHFIRDIGCIFTLIGVALAIAVFRPAARLPALLIATGFYAAHAGVHVLDTARGLMDSSQWMIDLVPIYGATALLVAVTLVYARSHRSRT